MNSYQQKLESGFSLNSSEIFVLLIILLKKKGYLVDYINHDYLLKVSNSENYQDSEKRDKLVADNLNISVSESKLCFGQIYDVVKRNAPGIIYYAIVDKSENIIDNVSNINLALNNILKRENIIQKDIAKEENKLLKIRQQRLEQEKQLEQQLIKKKQEIKQRELQEEERLRQQQIQRELQEKERLRQENIKKEQEVERKKVLEQNRLEQVRIKLEREHKKQRFLTSLQANFERNFIDVDDFYRSQSQKLISLNEYQKIKNSFLKIWTNRNLSVEPNQEQLTAIGSVNNDIQVVARAGSGKTSTIVNRALFLQKHCGIAPHEMLLLAFNRKAAAEIQKRLTEKLEDQLPHVMTFHALSYALVHPEEDLLFDSSEGVQTKSRALQSIIDEHLEDANFYKKIKSLMLDKFRKDWEKIEGLGYGQSPETILQIRRSMIREGLDGNGYKSFGEKLIANFLFEYDISYKYERNHEWNGLNYRPDFTIFQSSKTGIIIEYFGLSGDPDYDEMSEQKRIFWNNSSNWAFLELFPDDLKENIFIDKIKQVLDNLNIPYRELSDQEIWDKIKDRTIDKFTKAIGQFIQRCRKLSLTSEQLQQKIEKYKKFQEKENMNIVARFHELAQIFYSAYLERLFTTGEEDFDGLMQRAANLVKAGHTSFRRKAGVGNIESLKYIFIDEYQDFSDLFYNLIDAIRQQNSKALFFCVGDDWQAINGFAGSDLRFFKNFTEYFPDSEKLYLSKNYRSCKSIVEVSNSLMKGLGEAGVAYKGARGNVKCLDLGNFKLNEWETDHHSGDKITPAMLRIIGEKLQKNQKVVLLSRKSDIYWYTQGSNKLHDFVKYIQNYFKLSDKKKDDITISTTHKYKGLEKTVVIILDAVERCYPLIHPDSIFMKIFGDWTVGSSRWTSGMKRRKTDMP